MRTIPEDFYNDWNSMHHEASISLEDRENRLAEAADRIERELILIGATAIEDKLQDVCFLFELT
jgi:phospholipid-transporting ATPase